VFQDLCDEEGVLIVRGPAYNPKVQGSIESANKLLKRRLAALLRELGVKEWATKILRVVIKINNCHHRSLKRGFTPFMVWFGRSAHWESTEDVTQVAYLPEIDNEVVEDSGDELYQVDTLPERTEIEEAQFQVATTAADKFETEQSSRVTIRNTLQVGDLGSLFIKTNIRLSGEHRRIPVRIQAIYRNHAKVNTEFGYIREKQKLTDINHLQNKEYKAKIPRGTLPSGTREINLSTTVQRWNDRGSIIAAQKAGRKRAKEADPAPSQRTYSTSVRRNEPLEELELDSKSETTEPEYSNDSSSNNGLVAPISSQSYSSQTSLPLRTTQQRI
jgi:hypothetical protein